MILSQSKGVVDVSGTGDCSRFPTGELFFYTGGFRSAIQAGPSCVRVHDISPYHCRLCEEQQRKLRGVFRYLANLLTCKIIRLCCWVVEFGHVWALALEFLNLAMSISSVAILPLSTTATSHSVTQGSTKLALRTQLEATCRWQHNDNNYLMPYIITIIITTTIDNTTKTWQLHGEIATMPAAPGRSLGVFRAERWSPWLQSCARYGKSVLRNRCIGCVAVVLSHCSNLDVT